MRTRFCLDLTKLLSANNHGTPLPFFPHSPRYRSGWNRVTFAFTVPFFAETSMTAHRLFSARQNEDGLVISATLCHDIPPVPIKPTYD